MMRSLKEKWRCLVVVGLVSIFTASVASADTYNFYFKDKPKKGKKRDNNEQPDVTVSDDDDQQQPTNSKKKHRAINPLTAPANGQEEPHAALDPGELPPIIINNINNVAIPQAPPPPSPLVAENEVTNRARDVRSDVELMAGPPTVSSPKLSPWRFGAGFNYIKENRPGVGGSLSIANVRERGLGVNFFAGIRDNNIAYPTGKNWHLGGEMELMMVRGAATESGIPTFESGLLLGASTLSAHPDNWISFHTGLRVNVNLKNNVGLALVGRVNLGYTLAEAAITTRL